MNAIIEFFKKLFDLFKKKSDTAPVTQPPPQKPVPQPENALKKGSSGQAVLDLQGKLASVGFTPGSLDGMFGSNTEASVKAFQKFAGLVASGIADSATMSALAKEIANHEHQPEPDVPSNFLPPHFDVKSPRRLHADLEKMIDAKLMQIKPVEFKEACLAKNANKITKLAGDAFSAMQVREKTNNNDGVIVEMIQYTTHGSRGDAWCMDQQETQIAYAEHKTGLVSRFPMTASCADARARCPEDMKIVKEATVDGKRKLVGLENLQPGDVWIWQHGSGSGHTGNFAGWIKKGASAYVNEGNTTAGKIGDVIVREGGGSYMTERSTGLNGDMILRMAVRPF